MTLQRSIAAIACALAGAACAAGAKLTLLSGAGKQEVQLKPAGGNKLEAVGTFKVGPGTQAVAVVTIDGKPATARFSLK